MIDIPDGLILSAIKSVDAENGAAMFAIPAMANACFAEALFAYRWLEDSRLDRIDAQIDTLIAAKGMG